MSGKPNESEIWQHRKSGGLYMIMSEEATLEKDLSKQVIYTSLFDGAVWIRPYSEFFDGRFINVSVDEVKDCRPEGERDE